MKRLLVISIAVLILLAMTAPVSAAKPTTSQGQFSASFDYWQSYSGWGPDCYYGQPVTVHYLATNHWNWIVSSSGDVRENLVQNGIAEVYDVAGNLIDTRPFQCVEKFFDAGGDNSVLQGNWYNANAGPSYWFSQTMERYHYLWQINGVYQYECWNKNGNINWGWRSGTCSSASDADGAYPPHPPHP